MRTRAVFIAYLQESAPYPHILSGQRPAVPFKNHIGFYPAPRAIEEFKKELAGYEGGKGTIRFPLNQPIPFALIGRIVKFRVRQNLEKARKRTKR